MVTIVEPMQSSRRILRGILAASLLLATTGCELITGSTMCTTGLEPAVLVEVLDSTTLEPVRGGVRVIARDGALADTADTTDPVEFWLPRGADRDTVVFSPIGVAYERPGTYDVAVEAPGFETWERTGVRVASGACGPETVELTARLRPTEN